MKKGMKTLEQLKGKNPFRMPEGYMEDFTRHMIEQLPERTFEEPPKISWRDRILPWVYLAAAIAGLGLFFDVLNRNEAGDGVAKDNYIVSTEAPEKSASTYDAEDGDDYLDYLETQYTNYLLAEELGKLE
ncbi:MAG: hypothetical protein LBD21_04385 [Tannerellaceae bacterium]|jgi:hypothetical protein|nr:hypothetical protein [Tannerellaceae bacterium]